MNPPSLLGVSNRLPYRITHGDGVYLFDDSGNKYLDCVSSMGVVGLGHCNRYLQEKLSEQMKDLWHCYNFFSPPIQTKLVNRLIHNTFAANVFFCSTGSEAVEVAIKCIRRYQSMLGRDSKKEIITFVNSFHGRSIACLSASDDKLIQEGYDPLLDGFIKIPINDIDALKEAINDNTAGILLEPIQFKYNMHMFDIKYLQEVKKIAKEKDILLCFDEIYCGYGRTGSLFYYEQLGVIPDILTCSKAMGNGFPVAACLVCDKIANVMNVNIHSTYSGNILAMSVANGVLDIMLADDFFITIETISSYLEQSINDLYKKFNNICINYNGVGLMWSIELDSSELLNKFFKYSLEQGIFFGVPKEMGSLPSKSIKLSPPLITSKKEIDIIMNVCNDVFNKL